MARTPLPDLRKTLAANPLREDEPLDVIPFTVGHPGGDGCWHVVHDFVHGWGWTCTDAAGHTRAIWCHQLDRLGVAEAQPILAHLQQRMAEALAPGSNQSLEVSTQTLDQLYAEIQEALTALASRHVLHVLDFTRVPVPRIRKK